MPLPWTFARHFLLPLPADGADRALIHVRIFTDRWAGTWVIAGLPLDQPGDARAAVPLLRAALRDREYGGAETWVSYDASSGEPFRRHVVPEDVDGFVLPAFPCDRPPRERSATGTRMLQCGPVVDVWTPDRYRTPVLRRRAPAVAA